MSERLLDVLKELAKVSDEDVARADDNLRSEAAFGSETVCVPILALINLARRIEALEERNKRQDSRFVALLEDGKVRLGTRSEEDPA